MILIQCEHEATAQEIFLLIVLVLQLKNGDKPPFVYLDPCVDFNGVDIEKNNIHIMISCQNYIELILCAYTWDIPKSK